MDNYCMVSIIIPVYNVAEYLPQCVESVLAQTYRDIEVILVDDGSLDAGGAICDTYAEKDRRVSVIHKQNGGLSDARNAGIRQAKGEYVLFLDGDDYWDDHEALRRLMDRIETTGADVLNFSYKKYYQSTGKMACYFQDVPPMPCGLKLKEQIAYLSERGLYIASACNKLIRRCVLEGLDFPLGVYSEDITWSAELLLKARSMDFLCENFYCYRQRGGSITKKLNDKRCEDLASAVLICISMVETTSQEHREAFLRYTAFQYGTFVLNQARAEKKQTRSIQKLKQQAWILRHHGGNKKLKGLYLGSKLLGFEGLCTVARMIFR